METRARYQFGPFCLDTRERALRRGADLVMLPPRALDLLMVLVTAEGRIVGKEELLDRVWPGTFVEENNLSVNISSLRKVLAEVPGGDAFIETIPRRGYRFAAPLTDPDAVPVVTERTRTTVEVMETRSWDQRWLILAGVAVLGALMAAAWGRFPFAGRSPQVKTLAVLPFKGSSGTDELGFGVADALITRLTGSMPVKPTQAVRLFDKPGQDPSEAGRKLGVDAVLDGTLQRTADRVRLTVQLVRVTDGTPIWGSSFDQPAADLFALEDALSQQLAGALHLAPPEVPSTRRNSDPEVHRLILKGRYHMLRQTLAQVRLAIESLEEAVRRDPNSAEAWSWLAASRSSLAFRGGARPREIMPKAKEAAERALALDPNSPDGLAAKAFIQIYFDHDFAGAERSWRRALEISPDLPVALETKGLHTMILGRFEESLEARQKLFRIEPVEPIAALGVSYTLYYSGRSEEALEYVRKALELDPNFAVAYNDTAIIERILGHPDKMIAAAMKFRELIKADPQRTEELKVAYATGGLAAYDRKRLEHALAAYAKGDGGSPVGIALAYLELGEKEKSCEWLEKAYEERTQQLLFIRTFPPWKPLHGYPRFEKLRARMGLQ